MLGAYSVPCFCSWLFRSGSRGFFCFVLFWCFCIFHPEFAPTVYPRCSFLVSYSFFAFCCSRRDVSRCKHCSTAKGAQVPAGLSFLLAGGGPWCVCVVDSVMDSPKPPQIPFIISVQPAPAVPLQAFQWTVPVGLLRPAILVEPLTVSSEASRVWSLCFLFLQRLCCHWE